MLVSFEQVHKIGGMGLDRHEDGVDVHVYTFTFGMVWSEGSLKGLFVYILSF